MRPAPIILKAILQSVIVAVLFALSVVIDSWVMVAGTILHAVICGAYWQEWRERKSYQWEVVQDSAQPDPQRCQQEKTVEIHLN